MWAERLRANQDCRTESEICGVGEAEALGLPCGL